MTAVQMLGWMLAWGGITSGMAFVVMILISESHPSDKDFFQCWGTLWFIAAICVAAKYLIQ